MKKTQNKSAEHYSKTNFNLKNKNDLASFLQYEKQRND